MCVARSNPPHNGRGTQAFGSSHSCGAFESNHHFFFTEQGVWGCVLPGSGSFIFLKKRNGKNHAKHQAELAKKKRILDEWPPKEASHALRCVTPFSIMSIGHTKRMRPSLWLGIGYSRSTSNYFAHFAVGHLLRPVYRPFKFSIHLWIKIQSSCERK